VERFVLCTGKLLNAVGESLPWLCVMLAFLRYVVVELYGRVEEEKPKKRKSTFEYVSDSPRSDLAY
jgi:hypothetical protein